MSAGVWFISNRKSQKTLRPPICIPFEKIAEPENPGEFPAPSPARQHRNTSTTLWEHRNNVEVQLNNATFVPKMNNRQMTTLFNCNTIS